ncbi:MAG: carboxypeptidase regulatory-like domain-containing protein [Bryobacterales bacterium]|nr:carboxypeptidase regulatory-like domain-containing protein [Bryobacterales bacterium]
MGISFWSSSTRYGYILRSVLLLAVLGCGPAAGANLAGFVGDPSQAAVPGARVVAQHIGSGVHTAAVTDATGAFVFASLAPGRYRLTVQAKGFQVTVREGVDLGAVTPPRVDILLAITPASTSIEIQGQSEEAVAVARVHDSDPAAGIRDTPGGAVIASGGLSGLPSLRGLADDRLNILINGMSIGQACGNHMNPPLSYASPASSAAALVLSGVTPVRLGGDSTGGTIAVVTPAPGFLSDGRQVSAHGGVSYFHRGNGVVNGGSAWFSLAAANASLAYQGNYVNANNYKDGAGRMVKSTFYESQNHALQLAARRGSHEFHAAAGYQRIPQQGFVNARMDMTRNEAKYFNGGYTRQFGWGKVDGRVYYQDTRHQMNILRDKVPGMNMPMETRGVNVGYSLSLERRMTAGHTLRFGQEMRRFSLDDWWPPVMMMVGSMGPDTLWNVRDGRRNRIAFYGEWESRFAAAWTALAGVRAESVGMNTADVVGYNTSLTTTGSAMYAADAAEFNALDRARRDLNLDATLLARYEPGGGRLFEFGFARKTRSPGIYERYLWVKRSMMSVNMNGWFGDGNGYTGNLNLTPEVAYNFTAAAEWRGSGARPWKVRLSPFLTHMENFIDVRRCPVINDRNNGCTAMRLGATTGFTTLQFINSRARLAGVDGAWRFTLVEADRGSGAVSLAGTFAYVRGRRLDTDDYLYNIMPVNARAWVEHRLRSWSSAFEFQAVDAKQNVQALRNELRTPGYTLFHVRTSYRWHLADSASVRLDFGIDNLANRFYAMPLGGRYWIGDTTGRTQVPGMGRNLHGGLTFEF